MHIPVLKKEVLEHLDPKPNETFIDCTAGEGGHSLAILEKNGPKGKVLAIDQSAELLEKIRSKVKNTEYQNRLILVQDNFVNLKKIIEKYRERILTEKSLLDGSFKKSAKELNKLFGTEK